MEAQPRINRGSSTFFHRRGLASLLLASAALLTASIPYLRMLALPLSGLGVVLSAVAMISALGSRDYLARRKRGLALPLAGGVASLTVFLLTGFWLNQFSALFASLRKSPTFEQKTVPLRTQANRSESRHLEAGWVDASQEAVQFGDVRVKLVSATIGPAELKLPKGKKPPKEKYLIVKVRVSNAGAERVVQFRSWYEAAVRGEQAAAVLQDNQGKTYPMKVFPPDVEVVGRVTQATLPPGKKVEDLLIFEWRPTQVEFLRLELPASVFGSSGAVRMQIPGSVMHPR
jgi:hypothetical protein